MTPITMALSGAAAYPRACQALSSMLSKNALNPADITIVSDFKPLQLVQSGKTSFNYFKPQLHTSQVLQTK